MLVQTPWEQLLSLPKYDRIVICLFRQLTVGVDMDTFPGELLFSLEDIRYAMRQALAAGIIETEVANIPDIKYTYDARRELPAEVEQCGPMTWLQRGKGKYKFSRTRRKNIIDFPGILNQEPSIEEIEDPTPLFIKSLLGNDEQAVFTRVRNAGLLNKVLGFNVWPLQAHHRTTVSYGQIEVDEVAAGLDGDIGCLVPISGKGGQDKLSWSQVLNLNTYAAEKSPLPGLNIRSIGLWKDSLNTIWILEFSPDIDIDRIEILKVRRFRLI